MGQPRVMGHTERKLGGSAEAPAPQELISNQ